MMAALMTIAATADKDGHKAVAAQVEELADNVAMVAMTGQSLDIGGAPEAATGNGHTHAGNTLI